MANASGHRLSDNVWQGKRILVLLPRWEKTFINKNIGKLLLELRERDATIHLFCAPSTGDEDFLINFPGATLYNYRVTEKIWNVKVAARFLYCTVRAIRRANPDLVLWTYAGYRENVIFLLFKLNIIIKSDSIVPIGESTVYGRLRNLFFYRIPGRHARLVLTETPSVTERAQEFYGTNNVRMFPNGIPLTQFRQYEAAFAIEPRLLLNPYILFTGRIMYEKGVDDLIRAFQKVSERLPEWTVEIVGPVREETYKIECLELIQRFGLEDRIRFRPHATGKELYRWYYNAEFFVLPSRKEGLANRLTEAMYFDNPVVAFEVGETRSLVTKQTGELVPPGDVDRLAEAMLRMGIDTIAKREKGKNARALVEENYDVDVLLTALLDQCASFFE